MNSSADIQTEFRSTKSFWNYPCAHRQWTHEGNCRLIHGYSRSFHFTFGAATRDKCGFVVDYGDLDWLKDWLSFMFDHTLLLDGEDPHLDTFVELDRQGVCALRVMPRGVGMESTSEYICEYADPILRGKTRGRCWIISVESRENDKNSSIYINPKGSFQGWL